MDALKTWFNSFTEKEQRLIGICGVVLLVFIFVKLIWQPLIDDRRSYKTQNAAAAQQLIAVKELAGKYRALSGSGAAATGNVNLPALANQLLASYQLQIQRLQPTSAGDLQVRFENAEFNKVMGWLNELEQGNGIGVKDLSVTPGSAAGLVNVSMRLSKN